MFTLGVAQLVFYSRPHLRLLLTAERCALESADAIIIQVSALRSCPPHLHTNIHTCNACILQVLCTLLRIQVNMMGTYIEGLVRDTFRDPSTSLVFRQQPERSGSAEGTMQSRRTDDRCYEQRDECNHWYIQDDWC